MRWKWEVGSESLFLGQDQCEGGQKKVSICLWKASLSRFQFTSDSLHSSLHLFRLTDPRDRLQERSFVLMSLSMKSNFPMSFEMRTLCSSPSSPEFPEAARWWPSIRNRKAARGGHYNANLVWRSVVVAHDAWAASKTLQKSYRAWLVSSRRSSWAPHFLINSLYVDHCIQEISCHSPTP